MRIIDAHQHLYSAPDSLDKLVKFSEASNVVKVCLSAGGKQFDQPGNDDVKKAFERYPDLIVGLGYVRLGVDSPDMVERLHGDGFTGLKVINPRKNYSDDSFMPVYEKAAKYRMPILFHTGVVARMPKDKEFDTTSERMKPIFLDRIARSFPEITLIGAHMGVPWFDEACWVTWANPNVYFDLSGVDHFLCKKPASFFVNLTAWESMKSRLLFGVDTYYERIKEKIGYTKKLLKNQKFSKDLTEKVFYGNAAHIFGV